MATGETSRPHGGRPAARRVRKNPMIDRLAAGAAPLVVLGPVLCEPRLGARTPRVALVTGDEGRRRIGRYAGHAVTAAPRG